MQMSGNILSIWRWPERGGQESSEIIEILQAEVHKNKYKNLYHNTTRLV